MVPSVNNELLRGAQKMIVASTGACTGDDAGSHAARQIGGIPREGSEQQHGDC